MRASRREFLYGLLAGLFISSCGGGSQSSSGNPQPPPQTGNPQPPPQTVQILFGLGADPERMINGYDPDGVRVLNLLKPDIVSFWLNGAKDSSGRVYGQSMTYIRDWAQKGRFSEWTQQGYSLMLITWENYDGQNPELGPPTKGDYHISDAFLQDLQEILTFLRSQARAKVYIALATEQSTYTACRLSPTCDHKIPYTDNINDLSRDYYTRLRENLLRAIELIRNSGLNAEYGICFGGWLVEFQEGVDFIRFFEPVIRSGNAVFFQSMFDYKMSENAGYGNPQRILKNCQFFNAYGKPLHLAHYMPNNKRADVIADDMAYMKNLEYLKELYRLGLRSFSFMDYGVVKDNKFSSLDRLYAFRQSLKEVRV